MTESISAAGIQPGDARSWLLIRATDIRDFERGANCGNVDAVIVDLEDGVIPKDRVEGREAIARWSAEGGSGWVRINAATTSDWSLDLDMVSRCTGVVGIVLAKAESAEQIRASAERIGGRGIIPLIESAAGLLAATEIARERGTTRLAFGSGDFRRDTNATDDSATVMGARSHLVMASRAAGLPAPIDGPSLNVSAAVLQEYCRRSVAIGMGGMLCLQALVAEVVNVAFAPTEEEITQATQLLSREVESIDGSYLPRRRQAQAILDRAKIYRLESPSTLARRVQRHSIAAHADSSEDGESQHDS